MNKLEVIKAINEAFEFEMDSKEVCVTDSTGEETAYILKWDEDNGEPVLNIEGTNTCIDENDVEKHVTNQDFIKEFKDEYQNQLWMLDKTPLDELSNDGLNFI